MTTSTSRSRRTTRPSSRTSSGQSRSQESRSWLPRPPRGTGNIIGVIILVVAAFVAGYLIGRAGTPIIAAEDDFLVSRVIDGDTLELADGSLVRYLDIDAPGVGEPLYEEATERNRQLVQGKVVELVSGLTDVDESGTRLRYVYVDGAMVNAVLVGEGLARIAPLDEDELHAELLRDLEAQAREKGRGMWAPELQ